MGIERIARIALVLLVCAAPLQARQEAPPDGSPPLFLIDSDTRVASVGFRFTDGGIDETRLTQRIALHDPGALGRIRRMLAWLPFIAAPAPERFRPIQLQKDKVRLAQFLHRDGFPDAAVDYEVVLDTVANAVAVTFLVKQGEPRLLDSVTVAGPDGDSLDVPARLQSPWRDFRTSLAAERGERLSDVLDTRLRGRTLDWWRNHGYAFADVTSRVDTMGPDSRRLAAILALTVNPGPYARVGSIEVEGNHALSRKTILRELPFATGDEFRSNRLTAGQSRLFSLDLIRFALVSMADSQPADSTADVRIRIEEGSLHLIEGRVGYTSEQGIAAETSWSDRDFVGGARRLTLNGRANTGWWSGPPGPNSSYTVSATLRQPWLGDYRVSGLLSPFFGYRDDVRDRSAQLGLDATVVWERGPLHTLSASWGFANRRVYTARGGALTGTAGFLDFLRSRDTLDVDIRSSGFKTSATWGRLDDPVAPRSGWITRFGTQVTGPRALSNVEYVRLDGRVQAFLPIHSRGALLLRGGAGRLFPLGSSVPSGGDQVQTFLRLRDGLFTAGGTQSVRGWGADLLGPKIPDIPVSTQSDSVMFGTASRYVPLGGLDRWTASIELQLGMPFVRGPHSIHAFLDAGRVWTADGRFAAPDSAPSLLSLDDGTRFGAGAGIQLATPVGPLRLSLGYKLNPGLLDVRDPADVGRALLAGTPIEAVPTHNGRRWQLHLSIGRSF